MISDESRFQDVNLSWFEILFEGKDGVLGKGSFGKVQKVRLKGTNEMYALKTIKKRVMVEGNLIDQVKREIQVQQNLNHPNVVRLYAHFETNDYVYLLLEYCGKGELYTIMRKRRGHRFTEAHARQYFLDVVSGLQYMHQMGIVHRDLKPENLLVDEDDIIKICDFGWCGVLKNEPRATFCGTLDYLAPEMIRGQGHDDRLDLWGLGVLLYEMLVGAPPFQSTSQNELICKILGLHFNFPADMSAPAKDLIASLLRHDPDERIALQEVQKHMWIQQTQEVEVVDDIRCWTGEPTSKGSSLQSTTDQSSRHLSSVSDTKRDPSPRSRQPGRVFSSRCEGSQEYLMCKPRVPHTMTLSTTQEDPVQKMRGPCQQTSRMPRPCEPAIRLLGPCQDATTIRGPCGHASRARLPVEEAARARGPIEDIFPKPQGPVKSTSSRRSPFKRRCDDGPKVRVAAGTVSGESNRDDITSVQAAQTTPMVEHRRLRGNLDQAQADRTPYRTIAMTSPMMRGRDVRIDHQKEQYRVMASPMLPNREMRAMSPPPGSMAYMRSPVLGHRPVNIGVRQERKVMFVEEMRRPACVSPMMPPRQINEEKDNRSQSTASIYRRPMMDQNATPLSQDVPTDAARAQVHITSAISSVIRPQTAPMPYYRQQDYSYMYQQQIQRPIPYIRTVYR